ncbi:putative DNA modification/repair radical SAM protein [Diaphorobacter aerolatus]|uniref:Putative DNA modification/repair radical SAM protein n=1 Tax=Diaphorobacter aerolatus TaxID=1288495 RepID=A0A7H0GG03_9BURK|nr:putative DNA modification/repair radical SAM protein [Diaphorobacter aerolatus]QNP47219.1 putative DNA modification/repair radical SAM protein [Diaphorobacter aerolatus]
MQLIRKLSILADAAKYDASCASSGVKGRDSRGGRGIGSAEGSGICHSYTPDGRCVSLLKILLTNFCVYDCQYCINRKSSNVQRARFAVQEVVDLTLDFYRRNLIEGLFLSSGIIQSADYTMEQLVQVARDLREVHDFRGYIHLKTIPEASSDLLAEAGRFADRLSINIELPTEQGLEAFAPEKSLPSIHRSMDDVAQRVKAHDEERRLAQQRRVRSLPGARRAQPLAVPGFAPAGQSTQMIVGADRSSDSDILTTSSALYGGYRLRRVYYSAYSPIPDASSTLPPVAPPMVREHRLYQADWLMRFYGFAATEVTEHQPDGMLDLELDPKLAWALAHRHWFPVRIATAPREMLLRIPGLGVKSVDLLIAARRVRPLRTDDLRRLRVSLPKVLPFVELADHHPRGQLDDADLRARLLQSTRIGSVQQRHAGFAWQEREQLALF